MLLHAGKTLPADEPARQPQPGARAYNLLEEEVPDQRSCEQAGGLSWFCPCKRERELDGDDSRARSLADAVVAYVNGMSQELEGGTPCLPLQLERVVSATETDGGSPSSTVATLVLETTAATQPVSQQQWFAIITVADDGNSDVHLVRQVTQWGTFRSCADKRLDKQYCVCQIVS